MSSKRYKVNRPTVTSETVDGETIIINLESGNYYSLDGAGSAMWELIVAGHTVQEAAQAIAAGYLADEPAIALPPSTSICEGDARSFLPTSTTSVPIPSAPIGACATSST